MMDQLGSNAVLDQLVSQDRLFTLLLFAVMGIICYLGWYSSKRDGQENYVSQVDTSSIINENGNALYKMKLAFLSEAEGGALAYDKGDAYVKKLNTTSEYNDLIDRIGPEGIWQFDPETGSLCPDKNRTTCLVSNNKSVALRELKGSQDGKQWTLMNMKPTRYGLEGMIRNESNGMVLMASNGSLILRPLPEILERAVGVPPALQKAVSQDPIWSIIVI